MTTFDLDYFCRLTFNRLDFEVEHNGKKVRDYVYWKECNPNTACGPKSSTTVGGGYLVIYSDNNNLHTYEHPEKIFKKINLT